MPHPNTVRTINQPDDLCQETPNRYIAYMKIAARLPLAPIASFLVTAAFAASQVPQNIEIADEPDKPNLWDSPVAVVGVIVLVLLLTGYFLIMRNRKPGD
ncbi:MAG: hypothetical protein Kow0075_04150 [Salibacteraceae bacterium]